MKFLKVTGWYLSLLCITMGIAFIISTVSQLPLLTVWCVVAITDMQIGFTFLKVDGKL